MLSHFGLGWIAHRLASPKQLDHWGQVQLLYRRILMLPLFG